MAADPKVVPPAHRPALQDLWALLGLADAARRRSGVIVELWAEDVALEAQFVIGSRLMISDAPEFDGRWLSRLLHAGGYGTAPEIEEYDRVSFGRFSGLALDRLYETLERHRAPHRAGPDSARLVKAWRNAQHH